MRTRDGRKMTKNKDYVLTGEGGGARFSDSFTRYYYMLIYRGDFQNFFGQFLTQKID